jgi:hypothetical protein
MTVAARLVASKEFFMSALALAEPLRVTVKHDALGWTASCKPLHLVAGGDTYSQALCVLQDKLFLEYVDFNVAPSQPLTHGERLYGRRLRGIFWPKNLRDNDR